MTNHDRQHFKLQIFIVFLFKFIDQPKDSHDTLHVPQQGRHWILQANQTTYTMRTYGSHQRIIRYGLWNSNKHVSLWTFPYFLLTFLLFSFFRTENPGTHGHMKCVFDGQLKSFDTIFMYLYKRIFPKWTYEDCIVSVKDETNAVTNNDTEMLE